MIHGDDGEPPIRFGTRGSALALIQTELVAARFRAVYPLRAIERRIVSTEGDRDKTSPLAEIGGRGVFTNGIESALLRGEVDAAVHSAKDLPSTLCPAAPIVAFPDRDDPRDVLVSRHETTLERLPPHPVIGTSSRRREAQIRCLRPDAQIVSIRGNIDTRLHKAESSELDGIVLAAAGIHRLGWNDRISHYLPIAEMIPSPAQGAIAIQAGTGTTAARELAVIDDPTVSIPVCIERAFLAAVGAGCTYPVGAYVARSESGFHLLAMLANEAGDRIEFADEMLAAGDEHDHAAEVAARLWMAVAGASAPTVWHGGRALKSDLEGARIVVTRPRRQAGPLLAALGERGATPLALPTIRIEPIADTTTVDVALRDASREAFDWIVFTSANAVDVFAGRMDALEVRAGHLTNVCIAAVGDATAAAAAAVGLTVTHLPETATAADLAMDLKTIARSGARMLYPRSTIGRDDLLDELRCAEFDVVAVDVYRTVPEPDIDPRVLAQVQRGDIDLVTFASPSSVRNLIALFAGHGVALDTIPAVCTGPVTAQAAHDAGFSVAAIGDGPGVSALVEAIARYWRGRPESRVLRNVHRRLRSDADSRGRSAT